MSVQLADFRRSEREWAGCAEGLVWGLLGQVVSFVVSPGRSRAAGRSPGAPRDRARQLPGACRPISILRGCPASCRARRGIRPADRSAWLLPLPNAEDVAGDAAPVPRAVSRSAGGAWRGVALAARQRSAAPRGCNVWEYRPPIVNRDCHVSLSGSRVRVGLSFCEVVLPVRDKARRQTVRGEFAIKARPSRHTLVFGGSRVDPDHDAVIRIGGEAPGRRAHSKPRRAGHVQYRVATTSDHHLQSVDKYARTTETQSSLLRRHAITARREGPGLPAPRQWSPVAKA